MSGQIAYEAYAIHTGGKTHDGRDMPSWEDLPGRIQHAWEAAARAVAKEVYRIVEAADLERLPETQRAPDGYPG